VANSQFGLLGRKIGMTQLFDAAGNALGVTVVEMGPNTVLQVKTTDSKDGYSALQLGFGTQKPQRKTKAELGHLKKVAGDYVPRVVREIRVSDEVAKAHTAGQQLGADSFKAAERVDIAGVSKGKGFQGVMKRHNFSGFSRTHGVHEYYRHGGSIGTRLTPGMTMAGMKMGGHMGDAAVTVQNIAVVKVDAERNLLFLRGGVPGADGAMVLVRRTVKK
jgi:large subunit ribosomal protein L3